MDSIVRILLYSIMRISLCRFSCKFQHALVCILLYAFYHAIDIGKRGIVGQGLGMLAHCIHIYICVAIGHKPRYIIESILGESSLTRRASTELY